MKELKTTYKSNMIMKTLFQKLVIVGICIYSFNIHCNAQSQELQDCHARINSLFENYHSQITHILGDYRVDFWNIKLAYKHPNAIITYDTRIAKGYSPLPSTKLGKNSITFNLKESKFRLDYNQIQIFGDIDFIECGEKKLEGLYTFLTRGSSMTLPKRIYNELCTFQRLVNETNFTGTIGTHSSSPRPNNSNPNRKVIKMQKMASNTFTVPCKVNGLPLRFIFDTGASSVSISKSEAIFMLKNGYLSENDIVGTQQFQTASGDIIEGTRIMIRKIEIGGMVLRNVEASVVHSDNAPLLLGQSVLSRLGKIQIDYNNSTLTIIR